jgi:hypothetical protein
VDAIKNNLYWVILGAIVLIALVAYPMFVSDLETQGQDQLTKCTAKLSEIHKAASTAGKDDLPRTEAHVAKATQYQKKVNDQINELLASMKEWKVDQKSVFKDQPPPAVLEFDDWLTKQRAELYKQLGDAGISFPKDAFDKLTFADIHTADVATDESVKRPYRIKRMAILGEIINGLCKKPVKQEITKFQAEEGMPEQKETVDAGVIKVDSINVIDPDKAMKAELDRYTTAYTRAKRSDVAGTKAAPAISLPYMFTTVDVEFYAPLIAVPAIVKTLESSDRYHAVVNKLDVTRGASPFPKPEDVAKPGPEERMVNTYYREGPVKVVMSLNIYEFDASRETALRTDLGQVGGTH